MTKEEAWAAFAEQYNHRLHGPSDAFKFAWNAATKAEREACAKVCEEITNELSNRPAAYDVVTAETKQDSTAIWQAIGKPFVEAIRARGKQ